MNTGIEDKSKIIQDHNWRYELGVILLLIVITTVVFWNTNLDIIVTDLFYSPNGQNLFPESSNKFWNFLYGLAPWIISTFLLGSLGVLLLSNKTSANGKRARLYAVYTLLVIFIGPGLFINGTIKGHWSRPRPAQTIEFGGTAEHVKPLKAGESLQYKSFPSGHATTGFLFIIFWFMLRRRHKKISSIVLLFSILFGALMGLGRIAVGGHFLSDVLWAGYLTFLSASFVYYYVLNVPHREFLIDHPSAKPLPKFSTLKKYTLTAIISSMVIATLLAVEFKENFSSKWTASSGKNKPETIHFNIDKGNIEINVNQQTDSIYKFNGFAEGFGLPSNQIIFNTNVAEEGKFIDNTISYKGFYSEIRANYVLDINVNKLDKLIINIEEGNIKVKNKLSPKELSKLKLVANNGTISYEK